MYSETHLTCKKKNVATDKCTLWKSFETLSSTFYAK